MQPAISLLAVVPVRREASHRSEMVSQLLFGEFVLTGERKDDFVAVKCLYDQYEGWVQHNQLTPVQEGEVQAPNGYLAGYTGNVVVNGQRRPVPFGTPVYGLQNAGAAVCFGGTKISFEWPDEAIWPASTQVISPPALQPVIAAFLHTPYLWGGKSVFGTDCSGFVQQAFKLFGIPLLRDAYLQAQQGKTVSCLTEAAYGDLLFFQSESGRVTHVGILLEEGRVIHAAGRVRIDPVDSEGIINHETGERTHYFHSIRRFV